jgi:hypothetical protein
MSSKISGSYGEKNERQDNEGPVKLADFQTGDDGKVTARPEGPKSWYVNSDENNDTITVGFNGETRESRPIS